MRVRLFLGLLVLGTLGLASAAQAQIYAQPLETYGQSCFVYNNYAYLPLRSVTDFLGADLSFSGSNVFISLGGDTLSVIPGSTQAYYNGSITTLPVPPFDINGVTMVPVSLFHDYFFADIDWQPSMNRVFVYGPSGWGYCDVLAQPPAYAVSVIQSFGSPFIGPSAFFFDGVPFVRFHDFDDFLGLPIFFEPDRDDFVVVSEGRELIFAIGSPFVFFGGERFVLPASPVLVGNQLFVPANLFLLPPINAPVSVVGNVIRAEGPHGMRQLRIDPRAPARVSTTLPAQPARQLGIPARPAVIPGVVTPTPRPSAQALHPRVAPRTTAAIPAPRVPTVRPPTTAVRPMPPTTAVRPTPPTTAVRPTPPTTTARAVPPGVIRPAPQVRQTPPPVAQVRPAPRAAVPPSAATRPSVQARPTVPALRPGVPPEVMRQQGRVAMAPPRAMPQVPPRPAPERPQMQQQPAPPRAPQAQQRPAPGRPQAQGTPAPQRGGQGQARGRQQGQG